MHRVFDSSPPFFSHNVALQSSSIILGHLHISVTAKGNSWEKNPTPLYTVDFPIQKQFFLKLPVAQHVAMVKLI